MHRLSFAQTARISARARRATSVSPLLLHLNNSKRTYASMSSVEFLPLPLPPSADASKFANFGREVRGLDPGNLTPETFKLIEEALYKVRLPSEALEYVWVVDVYPDGIGMV